MPTPEGSTARKVLATKVESNTVMIYTTWIEGEKRHFHKSRALMLRGRAMLVLKHYIEEYIYLLSKGFELDIKLFFCKKTRLCETSIHYKDLITNIAWCSNNDKMSTSNFGILILPNYVPMFKDIVKYIASYPEHENVPSFADLYVVEGESSFNMPLKVVKNFVVAPTNSSSQVKIDRVYSYNKQYPGLCGSSLVASTLGSGLGAIIGIHVAGNGKSGVGFSEPIYKEMFEQFFNEFPQPLVVPVPVEEDVAPTVELDTNLMVYGCVPDKFALSLIHI